MTPDKQAEREADVKLLIGQYGQSISLGDFDHAEELYAQIECALSNLSGAQKKEGEACGGCNGHGMVGNIFDTQECPFCKGSGVEPAAAEAPAVPDESKAQKDFAGLLFDFVGWMTSGEPLWIFSSRCDATPGVEAIAQFAKMRGLRLDDPNIRDWHAALATQPKADSTEAPTQQQVEAANEQIRAAFEDDEAQPQADAGVSDADILKAADEWFVTGENQHSFIDGYRYRSLGLSSNVRGRDLIAFARAALALRPKAQPLTADMFWDFNDPERFAHELHDLLTEMDSDFGLTVGSEHEVECAMRLPRIKVRITAIPDADGNGELEWEEVGIASSTKEGS